MIKSITYKVRRNNRKIFFIIAIILVLISLIGFGIKHVMFYYENETEEMIKQRQTDLSTRKIINEKITQNNLANQKIGDDFNGYNIYIPEGFKLENDISKLGFLGNSDCRVFLIILEEMMKDIIHMMVLLEYVQEIDFMKKLKLKS